MSRTQSYAKVEYVSRKYSTEDLMAAILGLSEATAHGFTSLRAELRADMDHRFGEFEHKMNKRFDSVDLRFDAFERRLHTLEQ